MLTPKSTQLFVDNYRPIEVEMATVTPALATEWLAANQKNRNQKRQVINAYSRDIEHGNWMVTGESIKFDWNGRLIDGQHRLEAVVQSNHPMQTLVVRNLDPRVQMVLDVNAKRSAADALRFAGIESRAKDIAAIARVVVAYETGILKNALDNISTLKMTNTEILEWREANPDVEIAAAVATRTYKSLGTTPAGLGAAFLTLMRIAPAEASEFITSSAEFRTTGTGDPRKAMLDAFANIRSNRRAPSPAETLMIVFRAWNAYNKDRTLKLIRSGASDGKGGVTGVGIPTPTTEVKQHD